MIRIRGLHKRHGGRQVLQGIDATVDKAETIAKYLKNHGVIRIAQARRGLDQRIKHPLQVERRPADDLQNIGSGRLLFQGFSQLPLARLLRFE